MSFVNLKKIFIRILIREDFFVIIIRVGTIKLIREKLFGSLYIRKSCNSDENFADAYTFCFSFE